MRVDLMAPVELYRSEARRALNRLEEDVSSKQLWCT